MFGIFKRKPKAQTLPAPEISTVTVEKNELLPRPYERVVHAAFIVGHDRKDQGAVLDHTTKLTEYEYNKQIAEKLINLAVAKYPKLKVSIIFRDNLGIQGAYKRAKEMACDCVIELHFNASEGKKATGTVTLCTPDRNDLDFAHIIHKQICQAFDRVGNSRGVTVIGRSVRGAANIYAFPDGVNCLVEPFFGDTEAVLGIHKEDDYAKALLDGVMLWAQKVDLLSINDGRMS